ncbi:hypothetical protein SAMN05444149_101374 [Pseudosulfitobacter pseudonitzschiae]|uniref:PRC-barrel domain protein n=1 Tax=Pseudosulfitobacter pseudonitzschiae TaxID=1402135 RepID=A0A073JJL5_9RHOB|nr:hypothetical protein [Pseudosulfitobacter pseudonitzschiae]KEJ97922.1 hypothetical protein SUH3_02745 [Pseudosulfitobacter pseudonitzschiae]QKS09176.1 hypothetical protein HT745_12200 [Pseudosulfitobacter pseudonitzschiae]SHE53229.1 hypothetical protein SAMN05444149_101374 [Pseudosulfitobacter pseudonitzschiae]
MTRKFLTTTATIAALIAVPALAQDNTANPDLKSGSPAFDGGKENPVASNQFQYDTTNQRVSNGYAEFDTNQIAMSQDAFRALSNARGENLETTDGMVIGTIENVNTSAQGNPELVVDLADEASAKFDTEVLIITVTPGNVMLENGKIELGSTLDEMVLASEEGGRGDYADRKSLTLP